jgi:hypothetical protein
MSASTPKAEFAERCPDVRVVPIRDIAPPYAAARCTYNRSLRHPMGSFPDWRIIALKQPHIVWPHHRTLGFATLGTRRDIRLGAAALQGILPRLNWSVVARIRDYIDSSQQLLYRAIQSCPMGRAEIPSSAAAQVLSASTLQFIDRNTASRWLTAR